MRTLRRDIQIVFQDPYTSLNPRMTVGDIVGEPFEIHPERGAQGRPAPAGPGAARTWSASTRSTSTATRTSSPAASGSGSASPAALALQPEVIVCDEPVSALDVSVQAQVVNLLGAAAARARAGVRLHRPRPVGGPAHLRPGRRDVPGQDRRDSATEDQIYERPTHPYTQALLSAVPVPDPTRATSASRSCWPATCPARPTRRPVAGSAPGAGRRRRSAASRTRRSSPAPTARPGTPRPATSPKIPTVLIAANSPKTAALGLMGPRAVHLPPGRT